MARRPCVSPAFQQAVQVQLQRRICTSNIPCRFCFKCVRQTHWAPARVRAAATRRRRGGTRCWCLGGTAARAASVWATCTPCGRSMASGPGRRSTSPPSVAARRVRCFQRSRFCFLFPNVSVSALRLLPWLACLPACLHTPITGQQWLGSHAALDTFHHPATKAICFPNFSWASTGFNECNPTRPNLNQCREGVLGNGRRGQRPLRHGGVHRQRRGRLPERRLVAAAAGRGRGVPARRLWRLRAVGSYWTFFRTRTAVCTLCYYYSLPA